MRSDRTLRPIRAQNRRVAGERAVLRQSSAPGEGVDVPWCESCSRFYNPISVAPDGTCVKCGHFIDEPPDPDAADQKVPWHFWLLVAALVLYLGWRLIQFVIFLVTGDWPG